MNGKCRVVRYLVLAFLAAPLAASGAGVSAAPASAPPRAPFADPAFQRTWDRTDRPLSLGQVTRSWYWGPAANTEGLQEDYAEGAGGKRLVQYFDKSRMEINDPNGDPTSKWFVTNGLLTVELISGDVQVGNSAYVHRTAAAIPLASDTDDPNAPTYVSFQGVSNTPLGNHYAANRVGQKAILTIDKAGHIGSASGMASVPGTTFAYFHGTTHHNIPQAIWDFLNLTGPVYDSASGQNVDARLSDPWYYATGLPISEPYWAKVKIANQPNVDVLIQAFERRVVTYVPSFPAGFRVQMSNIGQHYYDWRYGTPPPPPQHTAAQFVGTWLNDDTSVGSVGKLWVRAAGNNLTVKWFGVCSPGFCDNQEQTGAYTGEPFNITLGTRSFSLSLNGPATGLKVVYQGNQTLTFHRVTPAAYAGTWLNDDAGTATVAKLWIKAAAGNLDVKWFGACGGSLCDNEEKSAAYNNEPFNITLNGRPFVITLDRLDGNKLKVIYQGTTLRLHKVTAADYNGTWTNIDPNTTGIVRFEVTSTGGAVHVHWFGKCNPQPCDNGVESAVYHGEPLVINTTHAPTRTFTITLDNAGGTYLKVLVTNAPGPDRTEVLKKQP